MSTYFLALALVFAFTAGHAVASHGYRGEWFYRYAAPLFVLASIACAVAS